MDQQLKERAERDAARCAILERDNAKLERSNAVLRIERDSLLRSLDASKGEDGTLYASVLESALDAKAQLAKAEARIVVLERELAERAAKSVNGEGAQP